MCDLMISDKICGKQREREMEEVERVFFIFHRVESLPVYQDSIFIPHSKW